jgi:IS1 family transposase
VQLDEKWSFVRKKQKPCDPVAEADLFRGDQWDHVALDTDSRLVLEIVVGKRTAVNAELLLDGVRRRLGGRVPELICSDEYAAYPDAIRAVFGVGVGRELPTGSGYGTVHKERERGRVVSVEYRTVFGAVDPKQVSTSYLERQNGTDRHRNARKGRKTYRFSKDWEVHNALTSFSLYSYNFCWPVRTLRAKDAAGQWQQRTPAMVAGLADRVWSLEDWIRYPALQR